MYTTLDPLHSDPNRNAQQPQAQKEKGQGEQVHVYIQLQQTPETHKRPTSAKEGIHRSNQTESAKRLPTLSPQQRQRISALMQNAAQGSDFYKTRRELSDKETGTERLVYPQC
jgi:hypothetical protein